MDGEQQSKTGRIDGCTENKIGNSLGVMGEG